MAQPQLEDKGETASRLDQQRSVTWRAISQTHADYVIYVYDVSRLPHNICPLHPRSNHPDHAIAQRKIRRMRHRDAQEPGNLHPSSATKDKLSGRCARRPNPHPLPRRSKVGQRVRFLLHQRLVPRMFSLSAYPEQNPPAPERKPPATEWPELSGAAWRQCRGRQKSIHNIASWTDFGFLSGFLSTSIPQTANLDWITSPSSSVTFPTLRSPPERARGVDMTPRRCSCWRRVG